MTVINDLLERFKINKKNSRRKQMDDHQAAQDAHRKAMRSKQKVTSMFDTFVLDLRHDIDEDDDEANTNGGS